MGTAAHSRLDRDGGFDVHASAPVAFAARLRRLPLVIMVITGLLLSLLHCANCGGDFAAQAPVSIAASNDQGGAPPDAPDQQLPCHGGHCLSHVVQQAVAAAGLPAGVTASAMAIHAGPPLRVLAGLPPFKPPRL